VVLRPEIRGERRTVISSIGETGRTSLRREQLKDMRSLKLYAQDPRASIMLDAGYCRVKWCPDASWI
jgi:hypothetical protein